MYHKSIQVTILIKITEQHEAKSTFLKNISTLFLLLFSPTSELNTCDSDFNCTTRKSTLSHTMVFLLQVMYFTKLNKPPPPLFSPPPQKCLKKNKPPGGLIEDLQYVSF